MFKRLPGMKKTLLLFLIIALVSCKDNRLQEYNQLVKEADRFEIYFRASGRTVPIPARLTNKFKTILTRKIEPGDPHQFTDNARIDMYTGNKRTGYLLVVEDATNSYANFKSGSLHFGFQPSYEIGLSIDNISEWADNQSNKP